MIYLILLLVFIIYFSQDSNEQNIKPQNSKNKHYDKYYDEYYNEHTYSSWEQIRNKVFEIHGHKCKICGDINDIHVHHIIPISQGGTNVIENLIPLCKKCHESQHNFKFKDNNKHVPSNYGETTRKENIILKAIENHCNIKIKYKASKLYKNSEITLRIVKPIKIILGQCCDNKFVQQSMYDKNKFFLLAYCYLRNENRLFRLDRILEIKEV